MNRRGYIVLSFLLAVIGIVAFSMTYQAPATPVPLPPTPTPHDDGNAQNAGAPMVQIVEDRTSTTYVVRDVLYPQFIGVDPEFNASIRDVVIRAMAENASSSAENWKARRETAGQNETVPEFPPEEQKFSFYVNWTPTEVSSEVISLVMHYGGFSGGAHGYDNIATFNYDLKKKEVITLKDLFPNDADYLKTISQQAITQLESDLPMKLGTKLDSGLKKSIADGAAPRKDNFTNFTFTRHLVTLYFGQYQVGPYVIGEPEVTLSRPQ